MINNRISQGMKLAPPSIEINTETQLQFITTNNSKGAIITPYHQLP